MSFIYLSKPQIIEIHKWAIAAFGGGGDGILHDDVIESAVAAPRMTFDGADLYPSLAEKAAAIAYPLIHDHPFIDGNKRTGFLAADLFIGLNGCHFICSPRVAEPVIIEVACGSIERDRFADWVSTYIVPPASLSCGT